MRKKILLITFIILVFTIACPKPDKKDNTPLLIGIFALSGGLSSTNYADTSALLAPVLTSFTPSSGAIGSIVFITGENFSSTLSSNIVKFNGTTATVTAATSTQLTVTVPTGTTKGKISVEVSSQTVTSTTDFTITCNPCRIFITSVSSNGNFGGVTGAQTKCDSDSNKPSTGTYKVYLKVSSGTSSVGITKGVKYTRVDGTVIVNSAYANGYLVDPGFISNNDVVNSISPSASLTLAWIGSSGTGTGGNCTNWTNSATTDSGFYISAGNSSNANQIGDGGTALGGTCATSRNFICIEQ